MNPIMDPFINPQRGRGPNPTALESFDRCAVQAGLRGDPMLGTAFPAPRLLLVEQPGPWGRAGLLDSRFERAAARRLVAVLDPRGVRVVAIRRPGRAAPDGRRRWALADCRAGRERLRWGRFDVDAELLEVAMAAMAAMEDRGTGELPARGAETVDQEPLFAVCAHGTHDVCCAVRGRPVAAALERIRPGRVWECSHVGGDRFAANVLVLPTGVLYGRVEAEDGPALVDAAEHGVVLADHLRGRVGLAPEVQAAMAHAVREVPTVRLSDITLVRVRRLSTSRLVIRLRWPGEVVDVDVSTAQSAPQWLTCHSVQPSGATIYRPMSLRRVRATPLGSPAEFE